MPSIDQDNKNKTKTKKTDMISQVFKEFVNDLEIKILNSQGTKRPGIDRTWKFFCSNTLKWMHLPSDLYNITVNRDELEFAISQADPYP